MIVDGHIHFWQISASDQIPFLRQHPTLLRDFLPGDFRDLTHKYGVDRAILVEAASHPEHIRWCLDVARVDAMVGAVVGWVDLEAPDVRTQLSELVREPKCVGIRVKVNRAPGPDWLLRPAVRAGLVAARDADLLVEFLVHSRHLPACLDLCRSLPDLRVVIDHGGQPDIAASAFEPWATWVSEIARSTTATCKLSGLGEVAGACWSMERLKPFFGHLVDSFGPNRLLFGSNWPVVNVAGGYERWWDTLQRLLDEFGLGNPARAALLGGTAASLYGLSSRLGRAEETR